MITHVILCTPRAGLTPDDERALAVALETAARSIPSVRRFTLGRRVQHGAGYEAAAAGAEFIVLIEFEDLAGLREYLGHPLHQALGRHFRLSLQDAQAYDFETGGVETIEPLTRRSPG